MQFNGIDCNLATQLLTIQRWVYYIISWLVSRKIKQLAVERPNFAIVLSRRFILRKLHMSLSHLRLLLAGMSTVYIFMKNVKILYIYWPLEGENLSSDLRLFVFDARHLIAHEVFAMFFCSNAGAVLADVDLGDRGTPFQFQFIPTVFIIAWIITENISHEPILIYIIPQA